MQIDLLSSSWQCAVVSSLQAHIDPSPSVPWTSSLAFTLNSHTSKLCTNCCTKGCPLFLWSGQADKASSRGDHEREYSVLIQLREFYMIKEPNHSLKLL